MDTRNSFPLLTSQLLLTVMAMHFDYYEDQDINRPERHMDTWSYCQVTLLVMLLTNIGSSATRSKEHATLLATPTSSTATPTCICHSFQIKSISTHVATGHSHHLCQAMPLKFLPNHTHNLRYTSYRKGSNQYLAMSALCWWNSKVYRWPCGAIERASAWESPPLPVPASMTFEPGLRPSKRVMRAASVE